MRYRLFLSICFLLISLQSISQQWIRPGSGAFGGVSAFHLENEDLIGAQLTDLRLGAAIGYRLGDHWDFSGNIYWQSEDAYKDVFPSQQFTRDQWFTLDHRRVIISPQIAYTDSISLANVPAVFTLSATYHHGWAMATGAEAQNGQFDLNGVEIAGLFSRQISTRWSGVFITPALGAYAAFNSLDDTSGFGLEDMAEDRLLFNGKSGGLDLALPISIRLGPDDHAPVISIFFSARAVIFSEFDDNGLYGRIGKIILNF
ncbi:MAG: hypothetical protein WBB45_11080 [Cyclobacteriaceae bacterium]